MSASSPYSEYFRCRTVGRAASPPTWACYEQIPYDDYSDSESEPCSEDDEDYHDLRADKEHDQDIERERVNHRSSVDDSNDLDMDIDGAAEKTGAIKESNLVDTKDVKGKQKAIEVEVEVEHERPKQRHQRKKRHNVQTLRPILTIQRSQGFVWNQDLFIPPYVKDRYVASTSPPNSYGFISTSVSSTNSALNDYEVEVVEIRVQEGDLEHIIP
ncbi:hypothetical protein EV361DRAFT_945791 [Lentinula raphanica]|uniref:Uncharacterized protein n=1 Tax=Lentinula raphanica TaxID=153919 RepID=A0AA38PBT9_9AGAR|nr:hypothetical protein C8R42DRAFT_689187 [Lentinula raphanica]KAJ3819256.1 hypothetical protein F5880DRAFT_1125178 [Lentinula raphanica]KAJ3840024.1 hypothetical protein F5878DRAFT_614545 [Lentinula raphanica]KAJ3975818.1 hypothetical protein EV361DRAFT_945791 [Lentinula raphanica]